MKTRNINIADYLHNLQLEYVSAFLRSKIYSKLQDKEYYETILSHKKTKIDDIAKVNSIKTIFTDHALMIKYQKLIFDYGVLNFCYRDEHQKKRISKRDLKNYYQVSAPFKYRDGTGEEFLCCIESVDFQTKTCQIKLTFAESSIAANFSNLCRIIS